MEEDKKARIARLLKAEVGLREICRMEGVSNTPVYKVMEELGIKHKTIGRKHREETEGTLMVDTFVCQGISYCTTCKRIFESVCPLGGFDV